LLDRFTIPMSTLPTVPLDRAPAGPHAGQPVLHAGVPLPDARAVVVLTHGRGGSSQDMLGLAGELEAPGVAFLAPQAADHTWYPLRFLAPYADNEPWLSSALDVLLAVTETIRAAGVPDRRVVIGGFSQGGCLALHFAATHARRWGGLLGLSAGLIGPPGVTWSFRGSLDGAPVFLGCSDRDPHIPETRLHETARALETLGGAVDLRIYPGLGHTLNHDELDAVRTIVHGAVSS